MPTIGQADRRGGRGVNLRRRNGEAAGQFLLLGTVSGTGAFARSGAGGGYEFALGTGAVKPG